MKTVEEMRALVRALVKARGQDDVRFGETSAWSIAAEICERLEGHNRNISILLSEIRKAGGRSEIPANLDAAARLAGAWSTVYSALCSIAVVRSGTTDEKQKDKAFAELCKISYFMTTLVEVIENSDD